MILRPTLIALLMSTVLLGATTALAQDKGSVDAKPLPPLDNPKDPKIGAKQLFAEEFKLHLFGAEIAYPAPELVATLSAIGEVSFPVLLVLGLGARYAALALLGMTAIIQLTVPDGWANFHLPWAAMALAIMTFGPGKIALDYAFGFDGSPRRG